MSRRPDREQRPIARGIILFLAGPVIWYANFWLVYLVAETACTQNGLRVETLGTGVSSVTAGLSALALLVVTALAVVAYRRRGQDPDSAESDGATNRHLLYWGGAILGALFALAILMVGIPALVLTPC